MSDFPQSETFQENKENFDYMAQTWTPPFKNSPNSKRKPFKDITQDVVSKKTKQTSLLMNSSTQKKPILNKIRWNPQSPWGNNLNSFQFKSIDIVYTFNFIPFNLPKTIQKKQQLSP